MTTAILFAAGKGSRLAPITDTLPKPLVSVQGATLLERTMLHLSPLVDNFIIVIGYLGDMIQAKIGDTFDGKPVQYQEQLNPKGGTLDAFRTGLQKVKLPNNTIVMNSDDLHGVELFTLLAEHIDQNPNQPAIGAHKYPHKSRLSQFGIIRENQGKFQEIVEKPSQYVSDLVNIGCYYIPYTYHSLIPQSNQVPHQGEEYITDFINIVSEKTPMKVIGSHGLWHPVSYPQDIDSAEALSL